MPYKLRSTETFEKDFRKLNKELRERVLKKLEILKTEPYSTEALHGILKGKFSLIIGKYRVVYHIGDDKKEVILRYVDHRGVIYKRIPR